MSPAEFFQSRFLNLVSELKDCIFPILPLYNIILSTRNRLEMLI